jgi:hypothetical protein
MAANLPSATRLNRAIINDEVGTVRRLLEQGVSVNTPGEPTVLMEEGLPRFTPLLTVASAVGEGNMYWDPPSREIVRMIVGAPDVTIDSLNEIEPVTRESPLLMALRKNNRVFLEEILKLPNVPLLDIAAVNIDDMARRRPATVAWFRNKIEENMEKLREKIKEKATDLTNAQRMFANTNFLVGPDSVVASYLTGIKGKSVKQQQDMLRQTARQHGVRGATRRSHKRKLTRRVRKNRK